jgi:hypothetical protein
VKQIRSKTGGKIEDGDECRVSELVKQVKGPMYLKSLAGRRCFALGEMRDNGFSYHPVTRESVPAVWHFYRFPQFSREQLEGMGGFDMVYDPVRGEEVPCLGIYDYWIEKIEPKQEDSPPETLFREGGVATCDRQ